MSHFDQAIKAAATAAAQATGRGRTDREIAGLVQKFERHPNGYLHARVVIGGRSFYLHRRYGSWLAPGQVGNHSVLKEPEALFGSVLGREIKFALSKLSQPYDRDAQRKREEEERKPHAPHGDSAPAPNSSGNDEAVRDPGLPAGGDRHDVGDDLQASGE